MKKFTFDTSFFEDESKAPSFINDWYDLALHLGVQPYQLSYQKRPGVRNSMQHKIVLDPKGDRRVVYKSDKSLANIQNRIMGMLLSLEEDTGHTMDQAIAYRKGVNAVKVISEQTDKKCLIKFDIKKYYDHITVKHLKGALMDLGFTKLGAQLVAYYCVVQRDLGGGRILQTLQQGSPASCCLSNLVGEKYIDKPIMAWIQTKQDEHPGITFKYLRYSDNVAVWVDGENIPLTLLQEFKGFVKNTLATNRFWTHKWSTIPNSHPKRNQQFLGVILNKIARIDKTRYERLRATLFNACRSGLDTAAANYWDFKGRNGAAPNERLQEEVDLERFKMVFRGQVSYVGGINEKHKIELTKLLKAADLLSSQNVYAMKADMDITPAMQAPTWAKRIKTISGTPCVVSKSLPDEKMQVLKEYKKSHEPVEQFLERLAAA